MASEARSADPATEIESTCGVDPAIDVQRVRDALSRVAYPGLTRDLVSFGMVKHVEVVGAQVRVRLACTQPCCSGVRLFQVLSLTQTKLLLASCSVIERTGATS